MAKRTQWVNYRVVITPRRIGDFGFVRVSDSFVEKDSERVHKRYINICEGIVQEVNRHVDGVEDVEVCHDILETCEYCYYEWNATEDGLCENCGR